jgi:MFS family permease
VVSVQALVVLMMAALALGHPEGAVVLLIILAVGYHSALNTIQPHWRAWMGSIVPQRRRGAYFAGRTRITMIVSLLIFVGGGLLLTLFENRGATWLGFTCIFGVAALSRTVSAYFVSRMHDPDSHHSHHETRVFRSTLRKFRVAFSDKTFRHYTLFVSIMQAVVAISAPFFAVYMLKHLEFSYFQYSVNNATSIATQFLALPFWGRVSDRFGNRIVMISTSCVITILPLLWTFNADFYYLLLVQILSGLGWSGFTLCTANYLYDIRPHRTDFASYAAVQSACGAGLVFVGALYGGYLAHNATAINAYIPAALAPANALFLVFIVSTFLRFLTVAWFIPRLAEPRLRGRRKILDLVFRISRFSAVSGVVLDWLTVKKKKTPPD